jgi:hypothetical protein
MSVKSLLVTVAAGTPFVMPAWKDCDSLSYSVVDGAASLLTATSAQELDAVLREFTPGTGLQLPTATVWNGDDDWRNHTASYSVSVGIPHAVVAGSAAATLSVCLHLSATDASGSAVNDSTWLDERKGQRDYVRGIKDMLRTNMMRDSADFLRAARSLEKLPELEATRRVQHLHDEAALREALQRSGFTEAEMLERVVVHRAMRQERLVPWCTNACMTCCMTKQNWAAHIREVTERLVAFVEDMEQRCRAEIISAHEDLVSSYRSLNFSLDADHERLHGRERWLFEEEELVARQTVQAEAEAAWMSFVELPWEATIAKVKATVAALQLREKSVEVLRVKDSLDLRERRAHRKDVLLLVEQEVTGRRGITTLEEVLHHQLMNKFTEYFSAEQVARCTLEIAQLKAQREELLDFQRDRLADDEQKATDAARKEQRELEEEYKEIKRLKKLKGAPPLPNCLRCEAPMQNPQQHRLDECPGRPAMCTKCELIMRFDNVEEHKLRCPARVIQCVQCARWYQAAYLEGAHLDVCLNVKEARRMITEELQPRWPFAVLAAVDGEIKGVLIRFDSSAVAATTTDSLASGNNASSKSAFNLSANTEYVLQQVDDTCVDSIKALTEMLSHLSIGERCKIQLVSTATPSPALGQLTAMGSRPVSATSQRRISFAAFAQDAADALPQVDVASCANSSVGSTSPSPTSPRSGGLPPPGMPFTKEVKVQTSIPLAEYRALALMTAEDDGKLCKPPAGTGKKGSASKR